MSGATKQDTVSTDWPQLIPIEDVKTRLEMIFPIGFQLRPNIVSTGGLRTVFAALYCDAVEGKNRFIAPRHIVKMSDQRSLAQSVEMRSAWLLNPDWDENSWYAENSRELRDTVITQGLIPVGAMTRLPLPPNSSKAAYCLKPDFARLFDAGIDPNAVDAESAAWRNSHLSAAALARIRLTKQTAQASTTNVNIAFPNGGGTVMPPGESPAIIKAVIENFAPRFLVRPVVLWISDSQNKEHYKNEAMAKGLGLLIDQKSILPDLIIADLGERSDIKFLIVFVEAVASEGPMTDKRCSDLMALMTGAGHPEDHVAFVTAYLDKADKAFRATAYQLAWNSFAWFASEPDRLIDMSSPEKPTKIAEIMARRRT